MLYPVNTFVRSIQTAYSTALSKSIIPPIRSLGLLSIPYTRNKPFYISRSRLLYPVSRFRLLLHSSMSTDSVESLTPAPGEDVTALVEDFVGAQVVKRALGEDELRKSIEPESKRPRRAVKAKATVVDETTTPPSEDGYDEPVKTPKKKGKKKNTDGEKPKEKKVTPKKSRLVGRDDPQYDSEGNEIVKRKRKPKVYPKVEYDIPDVERKETSFKGRLGYACLNTVLRSNKPDSIFCSRTCRLVSIEEEGIELPKGLGMMNVKDLLKMIEWNEQNNIRFMRMSSEMFPFASHAKYGYDLEYADAELKEAGALARKYGHRLTMHPGQFTQLGSPKENVIVASLRELDYQCEIMDRMGLDKDGVMIIHMGGVYGDKPSSLGRFKENYTHRVSENVKKRLVLENDEICYNVDDLLPVCNELDIPIIFDYHHDWINPSSEPPSVLIPKLAETWARRGIRMKQHLSEPRPGAESVMERRAHADRCKALPPDLPDDVDLMIEAKDKEQAVFELYRIYGLAEVIHDNLRPADPNPSMQTKGRKSNLKKKVKQTGDVDSDGEPLLLSDVEKEGDGGVGDEGAPEQNLADSKLLAEHTYVKKVKRVNKAKAEPSNVNGDDRGGNVKNEAFAVKEGLGDETEAPKKVRKSKAKRQVVAGEANEQAKAEGGEQEAALDKAIQTPKKSRAKKA